MKNTINQFWIEISKSISLNAKLNESELLNKLYAIFKKYFNNDISIEIYRDINNIELIFCLGHKKENIMFIEKLLNLKPKLNNISIIGPKPSCGFDFEIDIKIKI